MALTNETLSVYLFFVPTYLHLHEIHLGTYKKNQFTKLVRYVDDSFVKNYMSRQLIDQLFVQNKIRIRIHLLPAIFGLLYFIYKLSIIIYAVYRQSFRISSTMILAKWQ